MTNESCDTCRFFRRLPSPACRKNPPQVMPIAGSRGQISLNSIFPPTKGESWCGAYELDTSPTPN
jgi:hypothetical protein